MDDVKFHGNQRVVILRHLGAAACCSSSVFFQKVSQIVCVICALRQYLYIFGQLSIVSRSIQDSIRWIVKGISPITFFRWIKQSDQKVFVNIWFLRGGRMFLIHAVESSGMEIMSVSYWTSHKMFFLLPSIVSWRNGSTFSLDRLIVIYKSSSRNYQCVYYRNIHLFTLPFN